LRLIRTFTFECCNVLYGGAIWRFTLVHHSHAITAGPGTIHRIVYVLKYNSDYAVETYENRNSVLR